MEEQTIRKLFDSIASGDQAY